MMTAPIPKLSFSHVGFLVRDIERMIEFYTGQLGFALTDRGQLDMLPGKPEIAFLSRDPDEHHQLALVSGRPDSGEGTLNQISFRLECLADLRALRARLEASGVTRFLPMSHGNAWSLYFPDPEGNTIECFVPSPFHTRQPVTDPLDLSLPDEEILAQTESRHRNAPDFQPRASWRAAFEKRLR
jgi:catechol 2,3-dioxygenase-like lactoylglutathione lyase family enzyme